MRRRAATSARLTSMIDAVIGSLGMRVAMVQRRARRVDQETGRERVRDKGEIERLREEVRERLAGLIRMGRRTLSSVQISHTAKCFIFFFAECKRTLGK